MTLPVIPDIPAANLSGTLTNAAYPAGATPLNATSGDHGHASNVATLGATSNKTTYITGFSVTATGATSAVVVDVTVSDGSWTESFVLNVPASSAAVQLSPLTKNFNPPLQASATNTTIVVTCPDLGAGNTNCCVNAEGYRI